MPNEVVLVTAGEYLDERVIAVAVDEPLAQAYADRWNLTNHLGYDGDRAKVGIRVPFVTEAAR